MKRNREMKKMFSKRAMSVFVMLAIMLSVFIGPETAMAKVGKDPSPALPKAKISYSPDSIKSEYQNFWSEDGDSRRNNPTTRNTVLMFKTAKAWAKIAEDQFKSSPGQYWQDGLYHDPRIGIVTGVAIDRKEDIDINIAHAILEFLQGNCEIDENYFRIVKLGKNKTASVSELEWPEMRKYLGKFDPYTVLCKATKAWHNGKKAKLNPLEFCILFELVADSTGWTKGKVTRPSFSTRLIVGERKRPTPLPGGATPNLNKIKGVLDFRIEISWLENFIEHISLDMESVLRGELSVISAFNELDPENDYGNGLFFGSYQLKKFYKAKTK